MYLLIDSRDRLYSTDTASAFTIQLGNIIPQIKSVKLKRILMNHVIYNISSEYSNNSFIFYETSTNTTITMTSGYYTPNQLSLALKTLLNANSPNSYTYDVVYSSITSKFTISCTNNFIVKVSSLGNVMGYTVQTSSTTSQISDSITTLNDPSYMYLDLSCFASSSYTSSDIRTSFIISNNMDETEYNGLPNMCLNFTTPVDMRTFTVNLRNKDGSNVQMRGGNFAFLLELN
jgi:hypothetical protein